MKHSLSAKMHCSARIRERLKRNVISRDVNKMRVALLTDNTDCFLRREYPYAITGIVRYQNRWTTAVYDKRLAKIITVGVTLSKNRRRP
jgi:hypothetical protein